MSEQPLVVSQSSIDAFTRCRRKWWFGYYRGLRKREEYRSVVQVGTLVHLALEAYYSEAEDPIETLKREGLRLLQEHPAESEQILKDVELAGIMVEGYLLWLEETGSDEDWTQVQAEREIHVVLGRLASGRIVELVGRQDARFNLGDGWKAFVEHKSVGNFSDLPSYAQQNRQFLTYEMGELIETGERKTDGMVLNMLRRVKRTAAAKPPFYERLNVQHNLEELRNHWRHTMSVASDIDVAERRLDAGEDHHVVVPPVPTRDCRYMCPFVAVCRLFDDGSDAEWAVEQLYEVGDPFESYVPEDEA